MEEQGNAQDRSPIPRPRNQQIWHRLPSERIIVFLLFLCAAVTILTTFGIVAFLVWEAAQFFGDVSFLEFITGTKWTPLFASKQFGVLALVAGTVQTAIGAMIVALPLGLLSAVFLSEYAPNHIRRLVKPVLEVLAGIPTIVYGFFALLFITPLLRDVSGGISVFNGRDILRAVPIDPGSGCVAPNRETINNDTYRPLSRPLFIYVNKEKAKEPNVNQFVRFHLGEVSQQLVAEVGYVEYPAQVYELILARFENGVTGTLFGGSDPKEGSVAEVLSANQ